jgi:[acyl-carrier-protein] S-malonyltransferase
LDSEAGVDPIVETEKEQGMLGLLFSGQGAQYVGMGRALQDASQAARGLFARADEVLGYSLSSICGEGPESELVRTEHCQPGIYVVSLAAWAALCERCPSLDAPGVVAAAAGLSLGEYSALAAAGGFTFEDGLRLVHTRGRLMQEACSASDGAMASVLGMEVEALSPLCSEHGVGIANLNCPGQVVVSGERSRVDRLVEALKAQGIRVIPLQVAGAYHSPLMAPAAEQLGDALERTPMQAELRFPVFANVNAQAHSGPEEIRDLLKAQVVGSVRWEESMRAMLALGVTTFVELGPGKVLTGLMRRIDRGVKVVRVEDMETLEDAAAQLTG